MENFAGDLREHLQVPPAHRGPLNIAIIGGGSAYTPGLVEGMLRLGDRLPLGRLALMDVDAAKLEVVGHLIRRRLQAVHHPARVELHTQRGPALEGADFVLCQLRVGGLAARSLDEKIPLRLGAIGQETTGADGFAMALRTIPVMLEVARDVRQYAPSAWLINYTNPTGLVAGALHQAGCTRVLSLCDVPLGLQSVIAQLLGVDRAEVALDWTGLNHLAVATRVVCRGQDLLPSLADLAQAMLGRETGWPLAPADEHEAAEFVRVVTMLAETRLLCSPYLYYYLHRDRALQEQLASSTTRADEVMALEAELLQAFAGAATGQELAARRGYDWHADAMMGVVAAIAGDLRRLYIVNVPNRGNLPGLPADHVIEVPAVLDAGGARPLHAAPLPACVRGLVHAVAAYEELTIAAALEGSYGKALLALAAHPLVPSVSVARRLLDAFLDAHARWLPQFARSPGRVRP